VFDERVAPLNQDLIVRRGFKLRQQRYQALRVDRRVEVEAQTYFRVERNEIEWAISTSELARDSVTESSKR
jgi:hypothetical protein